MQVDLSGRVVFVTGGGNGIGQAIARKLAANGASIAIADIDHEGARRTAAELPNAIAAHVDIRDAGQVEAAIADLKEKLKNESIDSENTAAIREATEKVAATSQKLGQALYANAQTDGAAGAQAGPGDAGADQQGAADDDVVDAEIVDDENNKRDGAA